MKRWFVVISILLVLTGCATKKVADKPVDLNTLSPFDRVASIAVTQGKLEGTDSFKDYNIGDEAVIRFAFSPKSGPAVAHITRTVVTVLVVERGKFKLYKINPKNYDVASVDIDNRTAQEFAYSMFRILVSNKLL